MRPSATGRYASPAPSAGEITLADASVLGVSGGARLASPHAMARDVRAMETTRECDWQRRCRYRNPRCRLIPCSREGKSLSAERDAHRLQTTCDDLRSLVRRSGTGASSGEPPAVYALPPPPFRSTSRHIAITCSEECRASSTDATATSAHRRDHS